MAEESKVVSFPIDCPHCHSLVYAPLGTWDSSKLCSWPCGTYIAADGTTHQSPSCAKIERALRAAVEAEREACAEIADMTRTNTIDVGSDRALRNIAAAIRNRKNTEKA